MRRNGAEFECQCAIRQRAGQRDLLSEPPDTPTYSTAAMVVKANTCFFLWKSIGGRLAHFESKHPNTDAIMFWRTSIHFSCDRRLQRVLRGVTLPIIATTQGPVWIVCRIPLRICRQSAKLYRMDGDLCRIDEVYCRLVFADLASIGNRQKQKSFFCLPRLETGSMLFINPLRCFARPSASYLPLQLYC